LGLVGGNPDAGAVTDRYSVVVLIYIAKFSVC